jgi:hypothetical protein
MPKHAKTSLSDFLSAQKKEDKASNRPHKGKRYPQKMTLITSQNASPAFIG